jgi:class 3 adenylate cyclase
MLKEGNLTDLSANQRNDTPMFPHLNRALKWLAVAVPATATRSERRTYYALSVGQPPGLLLHLFAIFIFSYLGVPALAIVNVFSAVLWVASIILLRKFKLDCAFFVVVIEVSTHAILAVYYVGWGLGAQYYLLTLMAAAAIIHWRIQSRLSLAAISAVLFLGLHYYALESSPQASVDSFLLNIVNVIVSLPALLLPVAIVLYPVILADRAEAQLEIEYGKSESLLHNVLPSVIVDQLKNAEGRVVSPGKLGSAGIAKSFSDVSILFADVVGFTPMSERLTPQETVDLLDDVFSNFDGLAEKYGVEKIRTIGDGYMVAAGAPVPLENHARALVSMALEMQSYMAWREMTTEVSLQVRIGINSGAAVGGIVGTTKFHYDLWGDMVNTASRMESHGVPGKIQIARPTYELIKDGFHCEPRGPLQIKGKGEMEAWFVTWARGELRERVV